MTFNLRRDRRLRQDSIPVRELDRVDALDRESSVPMASCSNWLVKGFKGGERGGTKGSGKKVGDGVEARNASRSGYRDREEQFAVLKANVLDLRRKLARDPQNAVLIQLNKRQTATLQWLAELIASKDNLIRATVSRDKTETRSDQLQPIKRLERI